MPSGGGQETSTADGGLFWRLVHKLRVLIAGDALSTLVATVAVSPFAVSHFHRASYYGVFANLLALMVLGGLWLCLWQPRCGARLGS